MDAKTYSEVHETLPKRLTEEQLKAKVVELQSQLNQANAKAEALELVLMYANDVVNGWHTLTFRKVGVEMTPKVLSLGQALEAAGVKTK